MTLAELNNLAQEIANKLGHISQDLLKKIHELAHSEGSKDSKEPTAAE